VVGHPIQEQDRILGRESRQTLWWSNRPSCGSKVDLMSYATPRPPCVAKRVWMTFLLINMYLMYMTVCLGKLTLIVSHFALRGSAHA